MALSEGSKERIKLEAEFINTLAGNLFAIGVLAPLASYVFVSDIPHDRLFLAVIVAFLCFGGAFALHLVAASRLMELDR